MTNDALLVVVIDSVERLAVSVADQSQTGCVRYWCQSLQLGPIHSSTSFPRNFYMQVNRGGVFRNRLREP